MREVVAEAELVDKLEAARTAMHSKLHGSIESLLDDYLIKLNKQTTKSPDDEVLINRNARLACDLHAHRLLLYRNVRRSEMSEQVSTVILSSYIYLTTRHTWNKANRSEGRMVLPETELYELLTVQRRNLVQYANALEQRPLDRVMQTALEIATSNTGALNADAADAHNRWASVLGARSIGRFAVGSTRQSIGEPEREQSSRQVGKVRCEANGFGSNVDIANDAHT